MRIGKKEHIYAEHNRYSQKFKSEIEKKGGNAAIVASVLVCPEVENTANVYIRTSNWLLCFFLKDI